MNFFLCENARIFGLAMLIKVKVIRFKFRDAVVLVVVVVLGTVLYTYIKMINFVFCCNLLPILLYYFDITSSVVYLLRWCPLLQIHLQKTASESFSILNAS